MRWHDGDELAQADEDGGAGGGVGRHVNGRTHVAGEERGKAVGVGGARRDHLLAARQLREDEAESVERWVS